jgi:hypothetical protein
MPQIGSKIRDVISWLRLRRSSIFNAILAIASIIISLYVGREATKSADRQTAFQVAAQLAPLYVAQDENQHRLALKMLTVSLLASDDQTIKDLLGVALVNYTSANQTAVDTELRRIACRVPVAFRDIAKSSPDSEIRRRACDILLDTKLNDVGAECTAPEIPTAGTPGPQDPTKTDQQSLTGRYSVIIASGRNPNDIENDLKKARTILPNSACTPPTRQPCWWAINLGTNLSDGEAKSRLQEAIRARYPDAFVTASRSEEVARMACPKVWADVESISKCRLQYSQPND